MEDEITKRELSDDELDQCVRWRMRGECAKLLSTMWSTEAKTIFSREDGSQVECAVCGTGYWKI